MILNVIFLAGGIGIGYLIRGELDRRRSKKAWTAALDEGIKVAQKWAEELSNKKDDEDYEIDGITELFKDVTESSNSTDETIKL